MFGTKQSDSYARSEEGHTHPRLPDGKIVSVYVLPVSEEFAPQAQAPGRVALRLKVKESWDSRSRVEVERSQIEVLHRVYIFSLLRRPAEVS